jgi:hypothetical protein
VIIIWHVHVPRRIHGDSHRLVELAAARPGRAPLGDEDPGRGEFLNAVVLLVCNEYVSQGVDR